MVRCTIACRELLHCTRPSAARPEMRRRTSVATEAKAPSGSATGPACFGSRGCVRGGQLFSSSRPWLASRNGLGRLAPWGPSCRRASRPFIAVVRFLERWLTVHSSFDPWHQIRDHIFKIGPDHYRSRPTQSRRPLELAIERLSESEWRSFAQRRPTRGSHLFHTHLAGGDALPQHAEYKFLLAERNRRAAVIRSAHLNCFAY